jgi:DNA-binding PadR family transcriptional regulator
MIAASAGGRSPFRCSMAAIVRTSYYVTSSIVARTLVTVHSNDAQMLVLTVLADGPLHGYAINAAIEELTGRKLGPGSLYGALSRLEARGLIAPAGEAVESPERHRTMRITDTGRDTLRAELEQMARVSRAGLRALGSSPA